MDLVKIAVMGLNEAKALQKQLEVKNVDLVLNHDDASCTRGCAVTVEVLAKESDVPAIQEVYSQVYLKSLSGLEFDPEVINSVYDTSQETAICPACSFKFSTSKKECPDCGLVLG
jgi:rRNA maturation endonuclease Nob1